MGTAQLTETLQQLDVARMHSLHWAISFRCFTVTYHRRHNTISHVIATDPIQCHGCLSTLQQSYAVRLVKKAVKHSQPLTADVLLVHVGQHSAQRLSG
jgi:hypothetical protein